MLYADICQSKNIVLLRNGVTNSWHVRDFTASG